MSASDLPEHVLIRPA